MLEKVIQYVNESFAQSVTDKKPIHFERTVYWLKQLKPDADEPMQIAAYAHDLQRAFRKTNTQQTFKNMAFNDSEFLKMHQEEGAKLIAKFLREHGYAEDKIKRVFNMVRYHEEGGDPESDLIKDADSISFFEVNAIGFIQKVALELGAEKTKSKFDWMYNRIYSENARKIAEPMYKKSLAELAVV